MSYTWEDKEQSSRLDYEMWLAAQKCSTCQKYGHLWIDCPKWKRGVVLMLAAAVAFIYGLWVLVQL